MKEMKEIFLLFAKQFEQKNKTIIGIIDGLSGEEREKDRLSYYKSLTGLLRHYAGTVTSIYDIIQKSLPESSPAGKIKFQDGEKLPQGKLSDADWANLKEFIKKTDSAFVEFTGLITEKELLLTAKWFSGDIVPLWYIFSALISHNIHHAGQISQILDELHIDNDFSGINPKFI